MATPDTSYDTIVQYVDWGGHTRTVDPIRTERWVHEGGDERHLVSAQKGRSYSHRDVTQLLPLLDSQPSRVTTYLPTTGELDRLPAHEKYPKVSMYDHGVVAPFDQVYSYRNGVIEDTRPGERPIVETMHINGQLPDKSSKSSIVDRYMATQRRVQARILDS